MKIFKCYGLRHSKEMQCPLLPNIGARQSMERKKSMRCLFLSVLLLTLFTSLCNFAQAQSITLSVEKESIKTVLQNISKQAGYKLLYNNKHFQNSKPVTLSVKGASLKEVLDMVIERQPIAYDLLNKTILIRPRSEQKTSSPGAKPGKVNITGMVIDEKGNPLPGASVKVKNTSVATVTDVKGNFSLTNIDDDAFLVVGFIGYDAIETEAKETLMLSLKRSTSQLDEIQVIAYGTTTRRLSTGSIATVRSEDIERQPVTNPLATLQGRVPGLVITQTSGVPGSAFNIQIRGKSSLDPSLSQNNPLFIVDGIPFEPGNSTTNQISSAANNPISTSNGGISPLNTIAPNDIESIDILKDADATSIYGSRGANGVIIITTKKGKTGATGFNLNFYSGISRVGNSLEMLNTQQYVAMRKEAFKNDGITLSSNPGDAGYAPDIMLWDTTRYTDFKKLLIGNTAHTTNVQATISGGSSLTQFRMGTNYHRETTVFSGNFSDQIASFNLNVSHTSSDRKFNLQFSGIYSSDRNRLPRIDLTRYLNMPPNLKLFTPSGKLSWEDNGVVYNTLGDIINPLSVLEQKYALTNENLLSNLFVSYNVIDNLKLKVNFGFNSFKTDEMASRPSISLDPNTGVLPNSNFANGSNKSWIIEPQLEYNLVTSNGKLNIMIGNTFQDKSGKTYTAQGTNYNSDLLLNSIAAAGNVRASNDETKYRYTAIFGRINYNVMDRYIVNLSARRDGSSRFGPKRQWANFGAVGLAWLFSSEKFFKNTLPFFSSGKLRTSYGTTGNDQIGDYKFLNLWTNTTQPYSGISGLYPTKLYNPDYNWEINRKFESAIELGVLNERILLSTSYYNNRCSNQLIQFVLPGQTGFTSVVKNFPGLVRNTGFEISLSTKNIQSNKFSWTTAFNITFPKNKLISFPGLNTSTYREKYQEGQSLSIIRAFKYLGVDPQTGLYSFEDVNKDGVIYDGDYQYLGNTDPKYYGGIQNNISIGNIDLTFFFQFAKQMGQNYIGQLASSAPGTLINQPNLILSRWQAPGNQSDVQRLVASYESPASIAMATFSASNGIYSDASFIKLKNISVSYRLPDPLLKSLHIGRCRVYLEMQNLFTITNFKGMDPENQFFYMLPPLKTLVAGVQLNF